MINAAKLQNAKTLTSWTETLFSRVLVQIRLAVDIAIDNDWYDV